MDWPRLSIDKDKYQLYKFKEKRKEKIFHKCILYFIDMDLAVHINSFLTYCI